MTTPNRPVWRAERLETMTQAMTQQATQPSRQADHPQPKPVQWSAVSATGQPLDPEDLAEVADFFQSDIEDYCTMHGYTLTAH